VTTPPWDREAEILSERAAGLFAQLEALVADNARRAQDQAEYNQRYAELRARYDGVKARQAEIAEEKQSRSVRRENILRFIETLRAHSLNPEDGVWNWEPMDRLADFARENNLQLRGHTLIWPVQDVWMLWTDTTRTQLVDKATLFDRMDKYIETVMGRYGDVIDVWDVVNEPFHYDRTQELKEETNYFKIAGEEFATKAFEIAAKYADENDILMVNETFVEGNAAKTDNMFKCVERWLKQGVRIDGIGTQGHMGTVSTLPFDPNFCVIDNLAKRCRALGVKLEYTEIDIKIFEIDRQRTVESPPEWLAKWQIFKYRKFFEALRRNQDVVIGATFWGLDDAHTVINYNYNEYKDWPMLFDRNGQPKQNFFAVCDF